MTSHPFQASIALEGQGSVRWETLEDGGGKTFLSDMWAFRMW